MNILPLFRRENSNCISGSLFRHLLVALPIALALTVAADAQTMQSPDITKVPTLYVLPYAHLDTQWRWEFPQTISEYLLKTLRVNFDYIGKYPHYVFNWTGANRYRLMKEYFPDDYARMKGFVASGQWYPAGSSVEEGDVNLPSAEGIFRQILYGNTYFRHEFGKASNEYMLPDCFGFPASLPTILAHAGVKGFSTQKLSAAWQPAPNVGGPDSPEETPEGIPFNVGVWTGPDGETVLAALNPGGYGSNVYTDLSKEPGPPPPWPELTSEQKARLSPQQAAFFGRPRPWEQDWVKRIALDGKVTGVFADYHYVGTGDIGGATQESTVKLLEAIVTQGETVLPAPPVPPFLRSAEPNPAPPSGPEIRVGDGPVHVIESAADQMFNTIKPDMESRMPRYQGDLELINHSAGSLTSEAYHKRWIIQNENLANAAEEASIAAAWLGGRTYPQERLNDAWMLELSGHFHDIGAGTATPRAYQFAWNDDLIAANQFAAVLTSASSAIASALDTQSQGVPLVVYNPLNIERQDLVEASVDFPGGQPQSVRVFGPDGKEVPAQLEGSKVLFVARAPSVGYAVYDVRPATTQKTGGDLHVSDHSLENARYRVELNADGDVAGIYDKELKRDLLSGPMRLALTTDAPKQYPAWNMDFDQVHADPRAYVSGPAKIRISENGPVRIAIEVTHETEDSRFTRTVRLSAGDAGNRVEFAYTIDWKTTRANLKETFPLAASNENATYSWDIGTVQRPNEQPRQFEVASHRWIDLTDKSGAFGVTLLTDCKNGSDKPGDNTLRVTLLRSPGAEPSPDGRPSSYSDQASQDWGHHEFVMGLVGHRGDWREGNTIWQAYRLNDPLIAFASAKHRGELGRNFSLLHLDNPNIRVLALKKAEDSDEVVLRAVELKGAPAQNVAVHFAGAVASAREINAQEQPLGAAEVSQGALLTSFTAYQPRTFALKLAPAASRLELPRSEPVKVNYDLSAASNDDTATQGGGMDGKGNAIPAEMLPSKLDFAGVRFELEPAKTGVPDAMVAKGQNLQLPAGGFSRVYLLAASSDADQKAVFRVGGRSAELNIESWNGWIGQWDSRIWKNAPERDWAISANHAVWPPADFQAREARAPSPRFPEDYVGLVPGYVKTADLAWYCSHHHTSEGLNEPYQYSYLFVYSIDVPPGAQTLTLPDNDKVRIFAVSAAKQDSLVTPVTSLYDKLNRTEPAENGAAVAAR
jgi:alpha-mannosidase